MERHLAFLKDLPIFKELAAGTLEYVIYGFKSEKIRNKQYVFKEGEDSDYVLAVREGEFKIIKEFSIPRSRLFLTKKTEEIDNLN